MVSTGQYRLVLDGQTVVGIPPSLTNVVVVLEVSSAMPVVSRALFTKMIARGATIARDLDGILPCRDIWFITSSSFDAGAPPAEYCNLPARPRKIRAIPLDCVTDAINLADLQTLVLADVGRPSPRFHPAPDTTMTLLRGYGAGESEQMRCIRAEFAARSAYVAAHGWVFDLSSWPADVTQFPAKNVAVEESNEITTGEPLVTEVKKEEAVVEVKEEEVVEAEPDLPDLSTLSGLRTFYKYKKAEQIKDPMDALCLDLQCSHMSNSVAIPSETLLGMMRAARVGPCAGPQRTHTLSTPAPAIINNKARTGAAAKYAQATPGSSTRRSTHIATKPTPTKAVSLNELIESLSSTSVSGPKKKHLRNRPTAESYFSPSTHPGLKTPVFGVQPRRVSSGTYTPIKDDGEILPDYEEVNTSTESVSTDDEPPMPGTPLMEVAADERDPELVVLKFDFGADFISFADAEEEAAKPQMQKSKAGKKAGGAVRAVKVDRANPYSRPAVTKAKGEPMLGKFDFGADFISFADTDGDDEEDQAPKEQIKKSKAGKKVGGTVRAVKVDRVSQYKRPVVPRVQAALDAAREARARVPYE